MRARVVPGLAAALALALPFAVGAADPGHGSLDQAFGNGGIVTTAIGRWSEADALVIQPDGKLLVAGETSGDRVSPWCAFALVRYNPDGSLDTDFGKGGEVTTAGPYGCSSVDALVLQPDGKLVAAGFSEQTSTKRSVGLLVRYNPDGSIDRSFGTRGKVVTADAGIGLVLQPDGKLVTAGSSGPESATQFVLVRYTARGVLDRTFGKQGKVTTPDGEYACCPGSPIAQPDGKLILPGYSSEGNPMFRYNPNGSLDRSFGKGGKVTMGIDPQALALQHNGRIVVVGTDIPSPDYKGVNMFAVARYNRNGTRDPSFGEGGEVYTAIGDRYGNGSQANSVAIQPDGKIVAAGYSDDGATLARYLPNGALDRTFGKGGIVTTSIPPCCAIVTALAVQPDGSLVAAGHRSIDNDRGTIALARYVP